MHGSEFIEAAEFNESASASAARPHVSSLRSSPLQLSQAVDTQKVASYAAQEPSRSQILGSFPWGEGGQQVSFGMDNRVNTMHHFMFMNHLIDHELGFEWELDDQRSGVRYTPMGHQRQRQSLSTRLEHFQDQSPL